MDEPMYVAIHSCGAVETGDDLESLLLHCSDHGGLYNVFRGRHFFCVCSFGGEE